MLADAKKRLSNTHLGDYSACVITLKSTKLAVVTSYSRRYVVGKDIGDGIGDGFGEGISEDIEDGVGDTFGDGFAGQSRLVVIILQIG